MRVRMRIDNRVLLTEAQIDLVNEYNRLTEAFKRKSQLDFFSFIEEQIKLIAPFLINLEHHNYPLIEVNEDEMWAIFPLELRGDLENFDNEIFIDFR